MWCVANKSKINPQKAEVIRFGNETCDCSENRITLVGVEINESIGFKFLGVNIDNKLNNILNTKNHIKLC